MDKNSFEKTLDTEHCPVRQILDRISDKWSLLALFILDRKGVQRFNEIFHLMGDVSQKMLASTLRTLEADGLVSRKVYAEAPPRVEYRLTPLGKSFIPFADAMRLWAIDHGEDILRNRKKAERAKARA